MDNNVLLAVISLLGTVVVGYLAYRAASGPKQETTGQRLERAANTESVASATYRQLMQELRVALEDCETTRKEERDGHNIEVSNLNAVIKKRDIECNEALIIETRRRKGAEEVRDNYASTVLACQRLLRKFIPPEEIPQVNTNGTPPQK